MANNLQKSIHTRKAERNALKESSQVVAASLAPIAQKLSQLGVSVDYGSSEQFKSSQRQISVEVRPELHISQEGVDPFAIVDFLLIQSSLPSQLDAQLLEIQGEIEVLLQRISQQLARLSFQYQEATTTQRRINKENIKILTELFQRTPLSLEAIEAVLEELNNPQKDLKEFVVPTYLKQQGLAEIMELKLKYHQQKGIEDLQALLAANCEDQTEVTLGIIKEKAVAIRGVSFDTWRGIQKVATKSSTLTLPKNGEEEPSAPWLQRHPWQATALTFSILLAGMYEAGILDAPLQRLAEDGNVSPALVVPSAPPLNAPMPVRSASFEDIKGLLGSNPSMSQESAKKFVNTYLQGAYERHEKDHRELFKEYKELQRLLAEKGVNYHHDGIQARYTEIEDANSAFQALLRQDGDINFLWQRYKNLLSIFEKHGEYTMHIPAFELAYAEYIVEQNPNIAREIVAKVVSVFSADNSSPIAIRARALQKRISPNP